MAVPRFESTRTDFFLSLPNLNYGRKIRASTHAATSGTPPSPPGTPPSLAPPSLAALPRGVAHPHSTPPRGDPPRHAISPHRGCRTCPTTCALPPSCTRLVHVCKFHQISPCFRPDNGVQYLRSAYKGGTYRLPAWRVVKKSSRRRVWVASR